MANVQRRTGANETRSARASGKLEAVRLKRAYEEPGAADGYRVLVDRLWPRGVRKDALAVDAWMKDVGPSDQLRRWFGHDAARWEQFAARYRDELRRQPAAGLVAELVAQARRGTLTLVFGAKDELHNQAVVLRDLIEQRLRSDEARAPAARPPATKAAAARGRGPASSRHARAGTQRRTGTGR